jgi:hypothetical protein
MTAGMAAAVMTMKSPIYDGPIAVALGGADLSWLVGLPTSVLCYLAWHALRESPAASRAGASRDGASRDGTAPAGSEPS